MQTGIFAVVCESKIKTDSLTNSHFVLFEIDKTRIRFRNRGLILQEGPSRTYIDCFLR